MTNGRDITVTIIATSTKNNMSGDAKAIGTGKPYGPPNAPVLSGQSSNTQQVHWTWTTPANNGRPIQRFEVSYEGGGWTSVGMATRYDRDTNAWSSTKNLKVRACSVVCGPSDSANATSGKDPTPPPPTDWNVTASPVRSCTEPRRGTDSYVPGNPSQCTGEGKWLDAGAYSRSDRYQVWYKTSNNPSGIWYHLSDGSAAGNWLRCDTSNVGCNPPNGMPNK